MIAWQASFNTKAAGLSDDPPFENPGFSDQNI